MNLSDPRAEMYHALAGALAEPPEWLSRPGRDWPLFKAASKLAGESQAAKAAGESMAEIPAEPLSGRKKRYEALFAGQCRPKLWLHESLYRHGTLLSPETTAVDRLYRAAGVETVGAELPDHASLELSFLAYLAQQQCADEDNSSGWRRAERRFIEKHAGCWLPELGHALSKSGDIVYGPIGKLLWRWMREMSRPPSRRKPTAVQVNYPTITQVDGCTLCGFCAQVCPARALAIHETAEATRLLLNHSACIRCRKCVPVCESGALSMAANADRDGFSAGPWITLRISERARCLACDEATVSRAELDFVIRQIGHHQWLDYCPECRTVPGQDPFGTSATHVVE